MRTVVFMAVALAFIYMGVKRRTGRTGKKDPGILSPAVWDGESVDAVRVLAFNPKEEKNAQDFGSMVEQNLDGVMRGYTENGSMCRVEFITVDLCLVAVIRIREAAGKKKRGIGKIWNRQ